MGRRTGGRSFNAGILLRRVESCKKTYPTIKQLVDDLRSNYPDYRRLKEHDFTKYLEKTLDSSRRSMNKHSTANGAVSASASPKKNQRRRIDGDEERLQRLENQHVKRRKMNDTTSSSESSSESDSESDDEEEEEDGAVSTSEDAIYGEKVEPEFDLMKSMLRHTYSSNSKLKNEEKNVEIEDSERKVELINGSNKGSEAEMKIEVGSGSGIGDVKGKEGPTFRDLGGMESVLEELKMEVIVPLYHPQLPRWLGVRPMAGILLHGPPGCGKTELAHAIANETGVPFYKISATEVVSGVSGIGLVFLYLLMLTCCFDSKWDCDDFVCSLNG